MLARPIGEIDAVDPFSVVIIDRPIIITIDTQNRKRVQTPVLESRKRAAIYLWITAFGGVES